MRKKPVHIIVILLILLVSILLCTGFCFADSLEDARKKLSDPIYENAVVKTLELNAADAGTRATHDIDDIYNLLWYFFDSPSNLGPSFESYFSYNGVNLATINSIIYQSLDGFYDTYFNQGLPMIANINNDTIDISSKISTTNAKLEYVFSAIEDTINLKWYSTTLGYAGFTNSLTGSYINTNSTGHDFYFVFNFDSAVNDTVPSCYRVFVPCVMQLGEFIKPEITLDLYMNINGVMADTRYNGDYFVENTKNGFYIYLFDFRFPLSAQYYFGIHSEENLNAYNTYEGFIVSIPFDTVDYQLIRTAFNTNELTVQNEALDRLASLYASDDYISAKAAQQDYEDYAITNFTGSGSAAASRSNQAGLKDTSGALKSGLDSGGSVSNALGTFDSSSSLWQWFSTDVRNSLDTTSEDVAYKIIYNDQTYIIPNNGYNTWNVRLSNYVTANTSVHIDIYSNQPIQSSNYNCTWRIGNNNSPNIGMITSTGTEFHFISAPPNNTQFIHFSRVIYGTQVRIVVWRYTDDYQPSRSNNNDFILDFYDANKEYTLRNLNDGKSYR